MKWVKGILSVVGILAVLATGALSGMFMRFLLSEDPHRNDPNYFCPEGFRCLAGPKARPVVQRGSNGAIPEWLKGSPRRRAEIDAAITDDPAQKP